VARLYADSFVFSCLSPSFALYTIRFKSEVFLLFSCAAKFETDQKKRALNALQKEIGELKKVPWRIFFLLLFFSPFSPVSTSIVASCQQKKENADDKIAQKSAMEIEITEAGKASDALEALRDKKLKLIGNLVHDSVPVSKNEVRAAIVYFLVRPSFALCFNSRRFFSGIRTGFY